MTTAHTSYQRARLDGLKQGFNVDVTPAQHLAGQALNDWLNSSEDVLFEQCLEDLREMKSERERGYLPKPAPAP